MVTKKYPISLNDQDQENLKELVDLLGLAKTYGAEAKALKFGIRLALAGIKFPEKVYIALDIDDLDMFFSSITRAEKRARLEKKAADLTNQAEKV